MRKMIMALSFYLLTSSLSALWPQEEPELIVEVDRTQIYEGESISYQLILNHVKNPSRPKLDGMEDFNVQDGGEQSLNSSHITIVNNQMTRVERFGMAYNYILTPRTTGTFRIPAPSVEIDGRVLQGRPVTLKVISPDDQDVAILVIQVDRDTVYPLQEFTVTLNIYIRELPAPFDSRSPLSVQRNAPALSIPWVNNLSQGLVPATDWRQWLGSIMESQGFFFNKGEGFTINQIAASFPTEMSVFNPKHRRVMRPGKDGAQAGYWEYTLSRTFSPERTGEYHFGPVRLKGTLCTGIGRNQKLIGEDIYAIGKPVTVTVKDAPEEGRPPAFTGAIGRFELSAELAPTRARVGDPITLTLRLKGKGTLDRARPPDLESIPEIADQFKIYEATEETRGAVRTFTYSLRPLEAGIEFFPAVPLSYFDVERERYVTDHSDPIPLTIEEADQLADEDIITQQGKQGDARKSIEARKEGLFANVTDLGQLRDETVHLEFYALLLAGMAGFYFLVLS